MIKRVLTFFKNKGIGQETLNVFLGVLMLVALVAYGITRTLVALVAVIFLGALINITTGLQYLKKKEKKSLGTCMIMLGIIILVLTAFYVIR